MADDSAFPSCFPADFEERILPRNLKPDSFPVYRICKYGTLDKTAFLSTYEEVERGKRKPGPPMRWAKQLNQPGTYSTSCGLTLEYIRGVLEMLSRYHPKAFVAEGTASSDLGPLQKTVERTGNPNDQAHADWWLYRDSDPSPAFQRLEAEWNTETQPQPDAYNEAVKEGGERNGGHGEGNLL